MRRYAFVASVLILAIVWMGCATKVRAKRMAPAKYPIAGIRKLGVAEFKMECCTFHVWAQRLSERIQSEIEDEGFFQDVRSMTKISADDPTARWVGLGENRGVDGILAGTVKHASVQTTWDRKRVVRKVHTGRYRDGKEIIKTEVTYEPTIYKYAQLTVATSLLDVVTATRLNYEKYSERDSERREGDYHTRSIPTDNEMLEKLIKKVARRIVRDLVPHQVEEKIRLAGDKECKEGEKLAREGDWVGARSQWRAVLAANPTSHAALYNLGVADEVQGNYESAANYYLQAMELDGKKLYQKAWSRANERSEEKIRLREQLEGRGK